MTLNKKLIIVFVILFVFFLLLAVAVYYVKPQESVVSISVDGDVVREADLSHNESFLIETEYGINSVLIEDGNIHIEDADCPDKLCVRHGTLNGKYDSIVCLPHKLVIEYKNSSGLDAVAGR